MAELTPRTPDRDEVSPAMRAALERAYPVPDAAGLDRVVLGEARRRLGRAGWVGWVGGQRGVLARVGLALSAAAVLGLAAVGVWQWGRPSGLGAGSGLAARGPSGDVTILDAFALARQLRDGVAPARAWDVTGDGAVDGRDVEALAARAVRVSAGPGLGDHGPGAGGTAGGGA